MPGGCAIPPCVRRSYGKAAERNPPDVCHLVSFLNPDALVYTGQDSVFGGETSRLVPKMRLIHVAYGALFFNALPVLGVLMAAILSHGFSDTQSWSISFAYSLSDGFLVYLKLLLGTMVVPLVTAFALRDLDPKKILPPEASALLSIFAGLVLIGVILGSLYLTFMMHGLAHALETGQEPERFKNVPWDCAKENLTYVCLLLGIRLPKA